MEQHYPEFSEEDNLARITEMSGNFFWEFPFTPFNFIPGISGGERGVRFILPKIPVSISVISSGISGEKKRTSRGLSTFSKISYGEFPFHLTTGNFVEKLWEILSAS